MTVAVDFDVRRNVFILSVPFNQNGIASGMPDRKFYKRFNEWRGPALRLNAEYLANRREEHWHVTIAAEAKLAELAKKVAVEQTETMPDWYQYETDPFAHQLECINKAAGRDAFAIFHEQGLGKSWCAIQLATLWHMQGHISQVMVICPSSIQLIWEEQLEEHSPLPNSYHAMEAGKYKRATEFTMAAKKNPW